ncbi:MAG: hypothetical protein ACRDPY_02645 [Streptosporangiaceae bacterium]
MPARDSGDIKVVFHGICSHHLPHSRQVFWHFPAPWVSDKVTSHNIPLTGRTTIWRNKWHQTAWDNAGIPAFEDSSKADNNAPLVTDTFRQPGPNFPRNVKQANVASVSEDEAEVELPHEELLAELRILPDLDHLNAQPSIDHGLI